MVDYSNFLFQRTASEKRGRRRREGKIEHKNVVQKWKLIAPCPVSHWVQARPSQRECLCKIGKINASRAVSQSVSLKKHRKNGQKRQKQNKFNFKIAHPNTQQRESTTTIKNMVDPNGHCTALWAWAQDIQTLVMTNGWQTVRQCNASQYTQTLAKANHDLDDKETHKHTICQQTHKHREQMTHSDCLTLIWTPVLGEHSERVNGWAQQSLTRTEQCHCSEVCMNMYGIDVRHSLDHHNHRHLACRDSMTIRLSSTTKKREHDSFE